MLRRSAIVVFYLGSEVLRWRFNSQGSQGFILQYSRHCISNPIRGVNDGFNNVISSRKGLLLNNCRPLGQKSLAEEKSGDEFGGAGVDRDPNGDIGAQAKRRCCDDWALPTSESTGSLQRTFESLTRLERCSPSLTAQMRAPDWTLGRFFA